MVAEKHSGDDLQKTQKPSTQGEQTTAKLTEGIWEGPKDGSAPGGCVRPEEAWQKVPGNMSADDVNQAIKIVQDASGQTQMEFPPAYPTGEDLPAQWKEEFDKAFRDNAKINEDIKDLNPESQKHVKDGIKAIQDHDDKGIAKFLENATPEEKAAFIKSLKDIGYNVEEKYEPSFGGTSHDRIRISQPDSPLPSGILIDIAEPPPGGVPLPDFPGYPRPPRRPTASVAFEK